MRQFIFFLLVRSLQTLVCISHYSSVWTTATFAVLVATCDKWLPYWAVQHQPVWDMGTGGGLCDSEPSLNCPSQPSSPIKPLGRPAQQQTGNWWFSAGKRKKLGGSIIQGLYGSKPKKGQHSLVPPSVRASALEKAPWKGSYSVPFTEHLVWPVNQYFR